MFFLIGNNIGSVWAGEPYGYLSSEPIAKRTDGEGFVFGNGTMDVDVGLLGGYISGYTKYHIIFNGGASELEFPLKAYLGGINFGWGFKNEKKQEIMRMELKWLTNVSDGTGEMEDSDWISGDGQPGLDIYSESCVRLRAHIININFAWNLWLVRFFSIGPMIGYRYQFFHYDVRDTEQIGYGVWAPYTIYADGETLEYEVKYHLPYIGLSSNLAFGKVFKINASLGYAPWASANDEDDHVLRYKLSKADTDGHAFVGNLNTTLRLMAHLYLSGGVDYLWIETTGKQNQSFYAGPYVGWTAEVDDKIKSLQWVLYGTMTYRF